MYSTTTALLLSPRANLLMEGEEDRGGRAGCGDGGGGGGGMTIKEANRLNE